MKTGTRALGLSVVALSIGVVVLASCSDDPTPQPCTDIPAGGCPLSKGVACEDPSCVAVYACRAGNVWELDHTCPAHEAGPVAPDASSDADAAMEASHPFDASIDAPPGAGGGPGCAPLEAPDCALAVALACPSGCCGCEDLFVCQNGGWSYYATCK
jgi:hypothetical protein